MISAKFFLIAMGASIASAQEGISLQPISSATLTQVPEASSAAASAASSAAESVNSSVLSKSSAAEASVSRRSASATASNTGAAPVHDASIIVMFGIGGIAIANAI